MITIIYGSFQFVVQKVEDNISLLFDKWSWELIAGDRGRKHSFASDSGLHTQRSNHISGRCNAKVSSKKVMSTGIIATRPIMETPSFLVFFSCLCLFGLDCPTCYLIIQDIADEWGWMGINFYAFIPRRMNGGWIISWFIHLEDEWVKVYPHSSPFIPNSPFICYVLII